MGSVGVAEGVVNVPVGKVGSYIKLLFYCLVLVLIVDDWLFMSGLCDILTHTTTTVPAFACAWCMVGT